MFRRITLFLCLIALAFGKTPRPLANVPIHTPESKLIDLKKAPYRGKPTVLVIFSTTCQDCVSLIQMMDGIQKDFASQGLQVIGAAGDENARYLIAPFIARYRPSFPIGFLTKEEIIKLIDIDKGVRPVAPIVLFIDRWGMVREQYFGDHPIFRDAQRTLRSLSMAMIRVTPVAPAAATKAPQTKQP